MRKIEKMLGVIIVGFPLFFYPNIFAIANSKDDGQCIEVAELDLACAIDDDCVSIPDECSSCSCGKAVKILAQEAYLKQYHSLCEGYHGPVCDMYCPKSYPACVDHKCTLTIPPAKKMNDEFKGGKPPGSISGKVILRTGDCMPVIGGPSKCVLTPVKRQVIIHQRIGGQAMGKAQEGTDMMVDSDDNGFYRVDLPAGEYSVFVKHNSKEYCNYFDGDGRPCSVTVADGPVEFNITINEATD